jgi:hypothetical protein
VQYESSEQGLKDLKFQEVKESVARKGMDT